MEHRWGSSMEIGGRAFVGAATALAVVLLQGGAAFADDSIPLVPTPVGALVAGATPDGSGIALGFAGAGPAADLPPLGITVDPSSDQADSRPAPGAAGQPAPLLGGARSQAPSGIDRAVTNLAGCALTAIVCGTTDPARIVWNLLPFALGVPTGAAVTPPGQVCASGSCAAAGQPDAAVPSMASPAPASSPLAGCAVASPGQDCAGPSALDTLGLTLGTAGRPAAAVPASAGAPPAPRTAVPGSALASTGAPAVAALAGLLLLVVGGCLTRARART